MNYFFVTLVSFQFSSRIKWCTKCLAIFTRFVYINDKFGLKKIKIVIIDDHLEDIYLKWIVIYGNDFQSFEVIAYRIGRLLTLCGILSILQKTQRWHWHLEVERYWLCPLAKHSGDILCGDDFGDGRWLFWMDSTWWRGWPIFTWITEFKFKCSVIFHTKLTFTDNHFTQNMEQPTTKKQLNQRNVKYSYWKPPDEMLEFNSIIWARITWNSQSFCHLSLLMVFNLIKLCINKFDALVRVE